jgi:hypothetical protein
MTTSRQLTGTQDRCPHLNALTAHVRSFAEMMTRRQGQQALDDWLTAVEADDQHPQHKPPGHAAHWLEWRRRHQARSRWFHNVHASHAPMPWSASEWRLPYQ